jgi:hypothetical protein
MIERIKPEDKWSLVSKGKTFFLSYLRMAVISLVTRYFLKDKMKISIYAKEKGKALR